MVPQLQSAHRSLLQSFYLQDRNIAKVKSMPPKNRNELVLPSPISSLQDCYGQNAAAQLTNLLTNPPCRERITPVTLLSCYRIQFKILLITFKSLHGPAQLYISELLTPYSAPRPLRLGNQMLLKVPRSKFKTFYRLSSITVEHTPPQSLTI